MPTLSPVTVMNSASFLSMQLQISALPPPVESFELKLTEFKGLSKARGVKKRRDTHVLLGLFVFWGKDPSRVIK